MRYSMPYTSSNIFSVCSMYYRGVGGIGRSRFLAIPPRFENAEFLAEKLQSKRPSTIKAHLFNNESPTA